MTVRRRHWAGAVAGLILLAAAVATVAARHETIGAALAAVGHPQPALLALLAGSIVANLVLTGLTFSVLMSRHGKVGLVEMQALIAAASLMNFLPLRPGLLGRIAYHRTVNAIPAVASAKVTLAAIVLTAGVAACLAAALAAAAVSPLSLRVLVIAPIPALAAATAFRGARVWAAAALLRYLEVMVWALRYYAAFGLIGAPIGAEAALALACVGVIPMLIPLVGNGLGLREWAIGVAAPMLAGYRLELGLAADLVNRAAELVVILAAGSAGFAWLWRENRRRARPRIEGTPP